jgi:hypothetical protein
MKHLLPLAACMLFLLGQLNAQYSETFDVPNKGILAGPCTTNAPTSCAFNDFAGVNWTLGGNLSGFASGGYFRTAGGQLEANDVDEETCWLSPVLNMTGTASFSMDLTWLQFDDYDLSAVGSKDYIDVSYRIDDGSWITLPNAVGGGPRTISYVGMGGNIDGSINGLGTSGLMGTILEIRVCLDVNSNQEFVTIDNVAAVNARYLDPICATFISAEGDVLAPQCPGGDDGSVSVVVTGGTSPYAYSWEDDASTDSVRIGLPAGSYTVNILDSNGCEDALTFILADGVDNTPPTVICQNINADLDDDGLVTITPGDVLVSGADNCGTVNLVSVAPNMFDCGDIGIQTVTLTVNDGNGNTATCMAEVNVRDITPPVFECQDITVSLDTSGVFSIPSPNYIRDNIQTNFEDNCASSSPTFSLTVDSWDCSDLGPNSTTIFASDGNGNATPCTITVTVTDPLMVCNQPPVAVCQPVTVEADANCQAEVAATAFDGGSTDPDMDMLTFSVSPEGPYALGPTNVTLMVSDGMAMSQCMTTVTVQDVTPPSLACRTTTIFLNPTGNYSLLDTDVLDFGASTDNCSAITVTSISPSSFDCDDLMQTFDVLVTAQDDSGNSSQCIASITVFEGTALPQPWAGLGIGGQGTGSTYEYSPCSLPPVYTIETGAANNSQTGDNLAAIAQTLCGDFSIEVKIEAVTPNGWAGLTARESAAPGSKMIGMYSNLGSIVRWESRQLNNAPKSINLFQRPFPYWLRLVRQGNLFIGYYSVNGSSYSIVNIQNIPLGSCLEAGIAAFTYLPGQTATAVFSNLAASGGAIPLSIAPGSTLEPAQAERAARLWPNPAREAFTLEIPAAAAETRLRLLNQLGQPLEERLLPAGESQLEWGIGQLPAGLYFVEVFPAAGQSKTVLRFVKTD